MKHIPTVGEQLYTHTPDTRSWYVGAVRDPWTVIAVNAKATECIVQEAECIFDGPRYYNSLPDRIVPDESGRTLKLRWNEKKQRWQESPAGSYPRVAVFGQYVFFPYLD